MTPREFIEILKRASAEELAEIRSLLGVAAVQYVPQPVVAPQPPQEPVRHTTPWHGPYYAGDDHVNICRSQPYATITNVWLAKGNG